jgi:hypothetical protein
VKKGEFDAAFRGSFHEVRANELIIQTFTFEGTPHGVALERIVFEQLQGDRTRLTTSSLVESFRVRDAIIASGMETRCHRGPHAARGAPYRFANMRPHGQLHGLGASLLTGMPIAMALLTWAVRRAPAWHGSRRLVTWIGTLAVLAAVTNAIILGVLMARNGGQAGPAVQAGWFGRIELGCDALWLIVFARAASRAPRFLTSCTAALASSPARPTA